MMKTNRKKIPVLPLKAAISDVSEPNYNGYLNQYGTGVVMTGPGGICRNFRVGDKCTDILGYHVVPGVCLKSPCGADGALANYAKTGTPIQKCGGDAMGYVIGICSDNGSGILAAAFPEKDILSFEGDEQFLLICKSCGLVMNDYPQIKCNIDPDLLDKLPLLEENGQLFVPVAKILPEKFAGGLGADQLTVMTTDETSSEEYNLGDLHVGDFIMFTDIDSTYGSAYLRGAVTIGVVVDSGSPHVGGGPAVSVLFSCKDDTLFGYLSDKGNIACYFEEVPNAENK